MPFRLRALSCFVALLGVFIGRSSLAGPADEKALPADAKWYVHLDVEALRGTVLFQKALEFAKAQIPLEEQLGMLKQMIGVNPLTDISGITVYNNNFDKDVAAILIYAKVDQATLAGAVAQNPNYAETDYNKHKVLTWVDANDGKKKAGCFYKDGLIIMGDKSETVQMAVDVLDGTRPAGSALVKTPAKGSFLNASAHLGLAKDQVVSRMLSNTEAATATAGEVDGVFNVSVSLVAKTAEAAGQIRAMVDGTKAMIALGDSPSAAKLIQMVKVSTEGAKLVASFEHDSKDLIETLKKLGEEKKAKDVKNNQAPVTDPNKPAPGGL